MGFRTFQGYFTLQGFTEFTIRAWDDRKIEWAALQESFPQSRVELCWWFDEASVQFRIAGRGLIADSTTQDLQGQNPNCLQMFKATAAW